MSTISQRFIKAIALVSLAAFALCSPEAFAAVESEGQTVGAIAKNITTSLEDVSGLAEAIAYA